MKIKVFSRSKEGDIWDKMKEFIPSDIECVRVTGYDHWKGALHYLIDILDGDADYVVNVDIDCFIYDWHGVEDIISLLDNTDNVFAGMPDTYDNSPHRFNMNCHTNPFFNIFKRKECQEIINALPQGQLRNCNHEPFDGFFEALYDHGRVSMKGVTHEDGISTILNDCMIHTWYARDAKHAQRIEQRYVEAKMLWVHKGLS
jgi:hypothetical protein